VTGHVDEELEADVIGRMINGGASAIRRAIGASLQPGSFYFDRHRLAYAGLVRLVERGEPVDSRSLVAELDRDGELVRAGGPQRVLAYPSIAGPVANLHQHALHLVELAAKRRAVQLAQQLDASAGNGFHPDELKRIAAQVDALRTYSGRPVDLVELVSLEHFVNEDEGGAEPLVGTGEDILVPIGGDVLFYGTGGAGKTTLSIDLAFHLAAGDDWLGIPIPRPVRVLLVENEGPRPLLREKLRRKLAAWRGSLIDDRILVWQAPWGEFTLASPASRATIASQIKENAIDVLIAGPVTRIGMEQAGTLQEVRDFMRLVEEVRRIAARRFAAALLHHESKSGAVSGAWEGSGDTLFHVSGQGHGSTRLHIEKARWATSLHGQTLQLRWGDGDGFEVSESPTVTDDDIAERIRKAIHETPGSGWTAIEKATAGVAKERRRAIRDRLFETGEIVNLATIDGVERLLDRCPEKRAARLYTSNDPAISHLRRASGADQAQTPPAPGVSDQQRLRPAPRPIRGAGGAGADAPTPRAPETHENRPSAPVDPTPQKEFVEEFPF
jgi:hypothetical protein